jgi:hypothetical protein
VSSRRGGSTSEVWGGQASPAPDDEGLYASLLWWRPRAKRRVAPAASRVDISPDQEVDNLANSDVVDCINTRSRAVYPVTRRDFQPSALISRPIKERTRPSTYRLQWSEQVFDTEKCGDVDLAIGLLDETCSASSNPGPSRPV